MNDNVIKLRVNNDARPHRACGNCQYRRVNSVMDDNAQYDTCSQFGELTSRAYETCLGDFWEREEETLLNRFLSFWGRGRHD
jgi:hypothetical protein